MGAPATTEGAEQIIREHAALRRVATLVAQQPSPAEVFAAVTEETGRLLGAQTTNLMRVETPELAVIVAGWSEGAAHVPVGSTGLLDGRGLVGKILDSGRPSRVEDFDEVGGAVAASMRSLGLRSGVAGPVVVGGRIWGALVVCSAAREPLPAGTEDRVAAFAQLISLAIENAENREELAASRARLVTAADEARRRIERDLHDGAQQRLLATALNLTLLDRRLKPAGEASASCSTRRARSSIAASASFATSLAVCIPPSSPIAASKPRCVRSCSAHRFRSRSRPRSRRDSTRRSRRLRTSSRPRR